MHTNPPSLGPQCNRLLWGRPPLPLSPYPFFRPFLPALQLLPRSGLARGLLHNFSASHDFCLLQRESLLTSRCATPSLGFPPPPRSRQHSTERPPTPATRDDPRRRGAVGRRTGPRTRWLGPRLPRPPARPRASPTPTSTSKLPHPGAAALGSRVPCAAPPRPATHRPPPRASELALGTATFPQPGGQRCRRLHGDARGRASPYRPRLGLSAHPTRHCTLDPAVRTPKGRQHEPGAPHLLGKVSGGEGAPLVQRVGQKPALRRRSNSPASRHLVSTVAAATDRPPRREEGWGRGLS